MIIGKVVGMAVMTMSLSEYKNRKLLVVRTLGVDNQELDEDLIALDNSYAGIGDTVLVMQEGKGARQILNISDASVSSLIIGIIDSVYIHDFG